ncbi:hypothetical protein OUZ56_007371 [Daphnia magna]|uniref:Uncharacterized protein n=1 Tax=Daphnia magna TaxID=35525 RepID=A0ABR0A9S9_9CRUS|nr:hypothetical protein OUZ56_007371 [Daphnia magna]
MEFTRNVSWLLRRYYQLVSFPNASFTSSESGGDNAPEPAVQYWTTKGRHVATINRVALGSTL